MPAFRTLPLRLGRPFLAAASFFALIAAAGAQPSGGPYGPQEWTYATPPAAHIFYVAPNGVAKAAGKTPDKPTTIEEAIARAATGDAIVLRGGVYRTGNLVFNQGITLQPYAAERPVLKGTEVATDWQPAGPNVWKTHWTKLFPAKPLAWWRRETEEKRTPLHRFNNDMVFADGEFLQSAGSAAEVNAQTYYIDYSSQTVYVGVDPAKHVVEITARDGALIRTSAPVHGKTSDRKGPVIRGLTFTQYAWRAIDIQGKRQFTADEEPTDEPLGPADPATYGKEATGTLLENVTITFCSRVAGYFRGDGLTIRNSLISDTGTEGIYVIGSSDALLERNVIRRNNIEHLTGYYASAAKIFNQTHRVTVRDNLVLDSPDSHGVWFDVGNRDGVFVNNYVANVEVGFMSEISRGMTVAGNVFVHSGRGVWSLNSADVHVYANTFLDAPATFSRDRRGMDGDLFGWHPQTGPAYDRREGHVFENNLMAASEDFSAPLLRFDQDASFCGKLTAAQATAVDGNVYVRTADEAAELVVLSPGAAPKCTISATSLADLHKLAPQFDAHARQIDRTARTVFVAPDLANFAPREAVGDGVPLPAEVLALLGWTADEAAVGAYPRRR